MGYVWQKDQISRLSQQIKQRETRLLAFEELNEKQKKTLATMRSPAQLELRIKELNLGLGPPQVGQVWQLTEPAREGAKAGRELAVGGR